MIVVPLANGGCALIDDEDFALVARHRWHRINNGWAEYAVSNVPRKRGVLIYMHRLILGAGPGQQVDHVNDYGLDNRRKNIRLCTGSLNTARARFKIGKSGFRGVHPSHHGEGWQAKIQVRGKVHLLGTHVTPEAAAHAYDAAAIKHFGEFARLNFPQQETA